MKECNSCGKCCVKYSDGDLSASEQDIEMWNLFQPDIASYVKNGMIWFSPLSGKRLSLCPFLRKIESTISTDKIVYHCDIYYDRPEDCRYYPVTINQMIKDDCEMLEKRDLDNPQLAQQNLDNLLKDSRPSFD